MDRRTFNKMIATIPFLGLAVKPKPTKAGWYAWEEKGFARLDNRRVLEGEFDSLKLKWDHHLVSDDVISPYYGMGLVLDVGDINNHHIIPDGNIEPSSIGRMLLPLEEKSLFSLKKKVESLVPEKAIINYANSFEYRQPGKSYHGCIVSWKES